MNRTVDIATHARLYGWVWSAARLVFLLAFAFFVAIYYFTVVPSDYEVTERALIAQPIALGALVLAWSAVGHPTRSIGLGALAIYVVFALSVASILINLLSNAQAIIDYSERYPHPLWHQLVSFLGPQGPVIVFLAWVAPAVLVMVGGTLAAIVLRWLPVPGSRRTILQLDRDVRRAIAESGDAPRLWRVVAWSRWRGWLYGLSAAIVVMSPLLLSGQERNIPTAGEWRTLLPDVLSRALVAVTDRWLAVLITFPIAILLWRLARSHLAPTAQFVLEADQRPPILLLRSFEDDRAAVPANEMWRRLLLVSWLSRRRLEEVAARTLGHVGPFIAVGDPRQNLPELGAFRARLGDDEWQERVRGWMREARAIVIIAGRRGEGLKWELQAAAEMSLLGKVLLLMPPGNAPEREARWRHLAESLGASPWRDALTSGDTSRALSARFLDNGRLELVTARARRERDYDLALRVGLHRVMTGDQ